MKLTANIQLDEVTDAADQWVKTDQRTDLWAHVTFENVFSTDGGKTFTVSTERVDPDTERDIFESRKATNG